MRKKLNKENKDVHAEKGRHSMHVFYRSVQSRGDITLEYKHANRNYAFFLFDNVK